MPEAEDQDLNRSVNRLGGGWILRQAGDLGKGPALCKREA